MAEADASCARCGAHFPAEGLFCPMCGQPRASPSASASGDTLIGRIIGERYLLHDRIGEGGAGVIYRAEHVTLRRPVAVKLLHHKLSRDDLAIERFRREAITVAEIDNDHVVKVFDFGRAGDGRLFFTMELLEGETLRAVLDRDSRLGIARAVDILVQLGEALAEAHAMGYVHRDLRPGNVFLITRKGRADFVKLLDFGLSKLLTPEGDAKQTNLGMTFGDPRYMSPEQARGQTLDRRSDIYALGVIGYEMLCGKPPFGGQKTLDVLQKQLEVIPTPPSSVRKDVPPWLEAVLLRALSKRPDERFPTVTRMIEAIQDGQARGTAAVPPPDAGASGPPGRVARTMTLPTAVGEPPVVTLPPAPTPSSAPTLGTDTIAEPVAMSSVPTVNVEPGPALPSPSQQWFQSPELPDAASRRMSAPGRMATPTPSAYDWEVGSLAMRPPRAIRIVVIALGAALVVVGGWMFWPRKAPPPPPEWPPPSPSVAQLPKATRPVDAGAAPAELAPLSAALIVDADAQARAAERASQGPLVKQLPVPAPAREPTAREPTAREPTAREPTAREPTAREPTAREPTAREPTAREPTARLAAARPPRPGPARSAPARTVAGRPAQTVPQPGAGGLIDPYEQPAATPSPTAEGATAEGYIKMGRLFLQQGDFAKSAAAFNRAREYDPRNPDAISGLGQISYQQHKYDDAAVHFRAAVRLSPQRANFHVWLGHALLGSGHAREAEEEYRAALQIDPSSGPARQGLEAAQQR